jgi:hypothetical protein
VLRGAHGSSTDETVQVSEYGTACRGVGRRKREGPARSAVLAGPREQARRATASQHTTDRAVLTQMAADIGPAIPTRRRNWRWRTRISNVTLKNFVAPWTNRMVFVPLNDYPATVIGMVRDEVDFSTVLSADLLYVAAGSGAPAYSASDNNHYQYLDDNNVDLQAALQPATQSGLLGLPVAATAGIMTTRAAAAAFFINGTNRAMFRFTLINHLCRDMEQVQASSLPPDRIRQDVGPFTRGDSRVFLTAHHPARRHGSDGAGLRLLQLRCDFRPAAVHFV